MLYSGYLSGSSGFHDIGVKDRSCFLSFEVGEGVSGSNGNLFTHAQSNYIGEKLFLPSFIFMNSGSAVGLLSVPSYVLHILTHQ